MSRLLRERPYYYNTLQPAKPRPVFGPAPGFANGRAKGSLLDVTNWLFSYYAQANLVNSSISSALSAEMQGNILDQLSCTGDKGFLFSVVVFSNPNTGAQQVVGPLPVGSGMDPIDAVAEHYIVLGRRSLYRIKEDFIYDDARSFNIWISMDDQGELQGSMMPHPSATFREARRAVLSNIVRQSSVMDELDRLSRSYAAHVSRLEQAGMDKRTQDALGSLLRTRENLAASVERANQLWMAAGRASRRAQAWNTMRTAFSAANLVADSFTELSETDDEQGQTVISEEARKEELRVEVRQYIEVDIEIQNTIIRRDNSAEFPPGEEIYNILD